mgnify:FL=1
MSAIRHAAETADIRVSAIGPALGKSSNYFSATATRGTDPSAGNVARMLGVCGWSLCAMPSDVVPAAALIIGDDDEDAERIKAARRLELERRAAALGEELGRVRSELDTLE